MPRFRLIFLDGPDEIIEMPFGMWTAWLKGKMVARERGTVLLKVEETEEGKGSIEEKEFLESVKLERKLSEMQYDQSLTWQQRKIANEKLKEIINMPNYPYIPKEVYEKAIEQVKKAG